ncbi:MAG TPA: YjiH family protein [Candidatus Avanaerovorax faecigallinarum]|nr:YjiH family protein [Candidatus Avanaerovorax faecigallinarum]
MNANEKKRHEGFTARQILRFIIPSAAGAFLFMCPVPDGNGGMLIPITILNDWINTHFSGILPFIALIIIVGSAILSCIGTTMHPAIFDRHPILKDAFCTKWYWLLIRVLAAVVTIMVFCNVGPEWLIGPDTGSFVFYSLICTIIAIAVYGCGLLPLLTEFGLMDFVGTLVSPLMRKVFKLPGRAAVDCLSSWLGATSLGVLITNGQLEKGYYTQREAASIATNFSAVSIAFALVVLTQVGLEDQFFTFYLTVGLVAVVSAIILNRIPPLSRKPDTYITENPAQEGESIKPDGYTLLGWAWTRAVRKGNDNGYTVKSYMTDWGKNSCMMLFGMLGNVMLVGTVALVIAYNTPIFTYLGMPFQPLLELLQIPEAEAASQTMIVGFTDMFIPSVLASATITSPYTLFLVAVISITQVLYLSDNVAMILITKIKVNLFEMFIIFLERTIVSLVVASLFIRFVLQVPLA